MEPIQRESSERGFHFWPITGEVEDRLLNQLLRMVKVRRAQIQDGRGKLARLIKRTEYSVFSGNGQRIFRNSVTASTCRSLVLSITPQQVSIVAA